MARRSLAAYLRASLTAKICFFIFATETVLLALLGVFFLGRYRLELVSGVGDKMALPAVLMSQGALDFDAAEDLSSLKAVVQEEVVDAFIARSTGDIFYASDRSKIGRPFAEHAAGFEPGPEPPGTANASRVLRSGEEGRHFLSIAAPILKGNAVIGRFFLTIDAARIERGFRGAVLLYVLASALTVFLTALIAGFWVHRLFSPRIRRTVQALQEVKGGKYSTRLGDVGAPDQVGVLMESVNAMIAQIDNNTRNLQALGRCGEELANAKSRADIHQTLARVIAARYGVEPSGVCRIFADGGGAASAGNGECAGLSPFQRSVLLSGGIVLASGAAAGAGGKGKSRIYLPASRGRDAEEVILFEVDAGQEDVERGAEVFLRTLGRLQADAVRRVEALSGLQAAERQYRDLFSNAAEGIFRIAAAGRLESANASLAAMTGYAAPEALLADVNDGPGGPRAIFVDQGAILRRIEAEGRVRDFEVQMTRKDGSAFWAAMTARAVKSPDGAVQCVEGGVVDATERKQREAAEARRQAAEAAARAQAEVLEVLEERNRQLGEALEQLQRAQAKLVRSEKLSAMGTMAAGVAHDLNNILTGIIGYPDLLQMGLPMDSPLQESLGVIRESGMRAAAVVADLLTISRGSAYQTAVCDPNQLIRNYLESPEFRDLQRRFPAVRIATRLAGDIRRTECSSVHMQKVIMNLAMNACEAIHTSGEVLISTENRTVAAGDDDARSVAPGEYVVMSVADSGPGIPEEDLAHVFEPFFTKKVLGRSGTGLGLAVVWNTVQEHKGSVVVRSDERGAVFSVLLPATTAPAAPEALAAPKPADLRGTGSILVVDDDPLLRTTAAKLLTALGYTVAVVSSGEEAIAHLRDREADLVLLDMLMPPGMNGCEAYKEIVKIRPGQKAVICSGFSYQDEMAEILSTGAGSFLKKPYRIEELGLAVRRELERPARGARDRSGGAAS